MGIAATEGFTTEHGISGVLPAGLNNPLLAGNICSVFVSGLLLVVLTYAFPDKTPFNWEDFKTKITTSEDKVCLVFISPGKEFGAVTQHSA